MQNALNTFRIKNLLPLILSICFTACTNTLPITVKPGTTVSKPPKTQPVKPPEKTNPVSPNTVEIPPKSEGNQLLLQINSQQSFAINLDVLGFNTGFMFTTPMDEQPEVKNITKTLAPKVLRFSGGTISSYYHPDGLGYGFKEAETYGKMDDLIKTQALFKQNAMVHFADLCKISNSKVIYVANLLTGTTDEMVKVLEYFKSREIAVVGVELGNEYFFKAYAEKFPTVQTYIEKCMPYVKILRSKYPQLKIGAIAAMVVDNKANGEFAKFMRTWDQVLGKETFYDAYTVHLYPKGEICENNAGEDIQKIFSCTDLTLGVYMHNYHKITNDYYKQFYGNKKYWITEWNIDKPDKLSNTFAHAAFAAEYLMGMIDHNISEGNPIEYATFHNFGSAGYAYPLFSYATQSVPPINNDKTIAQNATYFPFLLMSQILQTGAERIKEKALYPQGISNQFLNVQCYISKDKKKLFVFFENKSGKSMPLNLSETQWKAVNYQALEANHQWSVAGMNGFYKKQPQMVDRMKFVQKALTGSSTTIPTYGVGYIEFQLK